MPFLQELVLEDGVIHIEAGKKEEQVFIDVWVDAHHPVTAGLDSFQTVDELYTCLDGNRDIRVLASSISKVDQREYPMAFSFNYGKGRVFHSPLGHDVRAFNPTVQALFRRGCAWVAGLQP